MRLLSFVSALALSASAFGCGSTVVEQSSTGSGGGSSSTTTGGNSTTSSTSSSSSGGGVHGDCKTNADCKVGQCVELTKGGYKVCASDPKEATMCSQGGGDECCSSADCAMQGGSCYAGTDLQFCGGAFPAFNRCVKDGCASDADCGGSQLPAICAPDGAFGLPKRSCLVAFCHTDADCTAKAGGVCVLVGDNPCCSHQAPEGLGCVYPGGCATDAECPGGACDLDTTTGQGHCGPPSQGCPP